MPTEPSRRTFVQAAGLLAAGAVASRAAGEDESKGEPPLAPPDKQPGDVALPDVPARKVGWAVVGLGKLALEEIMPAFGSAKLSRPVALVSGHPAKAKRVARAYGVPEKSIYGYEDFDKIADNEAVEVVYVVLPNSMHAEYTERAFKAGKHVLCEKPMAASSKEAGGMIAASKKAGKKLMIAYRLHYEPYNLKVMEMCRKKELGPVRTFSSSNCQVVKAPNIRLSKKLAGGPVGDVGVYCINAARYVTGEEPVEVTAFEDRPADPRFREVPRSVAFTLRFPSGALANCDCSFDASTSRFYKVQCHDGVIEMDPAFSYQGLRLSVEAKQKKEQIRLKEVDHFAAEMDHLSACVLNDKPPRTPGEEGLADMRVIEAIAEAARTGKAVKVARG